MEAQTASRLSPTIMTHLTYDSQNPFDAIRRLDSNGNEFWSARELMPLLGYTRWEKVPSVIERAKMACQNSGNPVCDHFSDSSRKTGGRDSQDFYLSRYAAYLTAMSGDSRKPAIAQAQTYFAVKTREAETNALDLEIREDDDIQTQTLLRLAQTYAESRRRIKAVEQQQQVQNHRIDGIEAEQNRYQHSSGMYYAVLAFAIMHDIKISRGDAAALGRKASSLCAERGIEKQTTYDPRFGKVGIYPDNILAELFGITDY